MNREDDQSRINELEARLKILESDKQRTTRAMMIASLVMSIVMAIFFFALASHSWIVLAQGETKVDMPHFPIFAGFVTLFGVAMVAAAVFACWRYRRLHR